MAAPGKDRTPVPVRPGKWEFYPANAPPVQSHGASQCRPLPLRRVVPSGQFRGGPRWATYLSRRKTGRLLGQRAAAKVYELENPEPGPLARAREELSISRTGV